MNLRAVRRSLKQVMRVRARKAYPDHPEAECYADNMAACSCPMCGNPRRHSKGKDRFTIQERREDERRFDEEVR